MKNIILYTAGAVAVILTVDALGFIAWIASGQTPVDGFHAGRITAEVLRALFI